MSTILLTGFEAFGGSAVNPSAQLAAALAGATVGGFAIETMVLPVVTVEAGDRLDAAIAAIGPAFVVCCGEDGRAAEIRVERVAVNRREFEADNLGTACRNLPVVEGGPESIEATLPVERLVAASLAASVPAAASDS
ncbi:MAG: pyroglutamyl-peptidase I, partial [Phycisphaerales bacterium]